MVATMAAPATKVKVTVNLPQQDIDTLRSIADRKGITMTEALRRAIALEQFVEEAVGRGANILIEEKGKTLRQVVIR
jgi:hypothetical protein